MSLVSPPIRLCIVNRNYPPVKGATGRSARNFVAYLEKIGGFDIQVVTVDSLSDTGSKTYVKSLYDGKLKILRLFSTLIESLLLIRVAKKREADVFLILTDPPFLNYWAARFLSNKKWILWTMDLYPEAFTAGRLISSSNWLYRHYERVIKNNPPDFFIALGPGQNNYLKTKYFNNTPSTVLPVGVIDSKEFTASEDELLPSWTNDKKIIFGYIGTIGEAHDAQAVIGFIEHLDDKKHHCILCCSGSKAESVLDKASNYPHVTILDYLPQNEMKFIDIQIVSLLSSWTHTCVPSKALSGISALNAIIFFGDIKSDTWVYTYRAGWCVSNETNGFDILSEIDKKSLFKRKKEAYKISEDLKRQVLLSYQAIVCELKKLGK